MADDGAATAAEPIVRLAKKGLMPLRSSGVDNRCWIVRSTSGPAILTGNDHAALDLSGINHRSERHESVETPSMRSRGRRSGSCR